MKTKTLNSKTLTALAIMAFLSVAAPTYATDFFPLDVWEELEIWEQNNGELYATVTEASGVPMSMDTGKLEIDHTSFPFDVLKEINDLGGIDWNGWEAFNKGYGGTNENKTNPYWYPEEYRTP
jgi:hypothetical protein